MKIIILFFTYFISFLHSEVLTHSNALSKTRVFKSDDGEEMYFQDGSDDSSFSYVRFENLINKDLNGHVFKLVDRVVSNKKKFFIVQKKGSKKNEYCLLIQVGSSFSHSSYMVYLPEKKYETYFTQTKEEAPTGKRDLKLIYEKEKYDPDFF